MAKFQPLNLGKILHQGRPLNRRTRLELVNIAGRMIERVATLEDEVRALNDALLGKEQSLRQCIRDKDTAVNALRVADIGLAQRDSKIADLEKQAKELQEALDNSDDRLIDAMEGCDKVFWHGVWAAIWNCIGGIGLGIWFAPTAHALWVRIFGG